MESKTRLLKVSVKILAIDSNYEPATESAFRYRNKHVYPSFEKLGFAVLRCQGKLARRVHVKQDAVRSGLVYITGVGHGTEARYTGDQYTPVFELGEYQPQEARGKVVHFLSCLTAAQLGPDFVNNGCLAYFGYDVNFTFDQNYADIFFECDSEIDLAFAEGLNADQVFTRVQDLYDRKILELQNDGHEYVAELLIYDRDHLCAPSVDARWGKKSARITTSNM